MFCMFLGNKGRCQARPLYYCPYSLLESKNACACCYVAKVNGFSARIVSYSKNSVTLFHGALCLRSHIAVCSRSSSVPPLMILNQFLNILFFAKMSGTLASNQLEVLEFKSWGQSCFTNWQVVSLDYGPLLLQMKANVMCFLRFFRHVICKFAAFAFALFLSSSGCAWLFRYLSSFFPSLLESR